MGFNQQKLQRTMSDPSSISEKELEELQNVVAAYPYFQLGHSLIAKVKHDQQAVDAEKALHLAAIYAPSRRRLKQLFYNDQHIGSVSEDYNNVSSENSPSISSESTAEVEADHTIHTDINEKTPTAEEKERSSEDAIYKELEENLQQLRASRQQTPTNPPEDSSEENNKKKIIEKTEDGIASKSDDQTQDAQPLNKKQASDYHAPYLIDYLKDIEPIQSDRLGINQKHQRELIDKFMNSDRSSSLRWRLQEQEQKDLSEKNTTSANNFVTENLADIYVRQEKKDKAIEIYKKLILKYPHKKTYFAEKIESLKEN